MSTSHASRNRPASSPYVDRDVLGELGTMACDRFDDFLGWFNVDLRRVGRRYVGYCPVHGGASNVESFNIYEDEGDFHGLRGNWKCWTNPDCEKTFNHRTPIGFVRGVMSHDAFGWSSEGDRVVEHRTAVDEICRFLGISIDDVKVDPSRRERRRLVRTAEVLSPGVADHRAICTAEQFKKWHSIPSSYYLGRGYEEETLGTFLVGENRVRNSKTFSRTSIPIFDEEGRSIIGILSRSPHEKCPQCRMNHAEGGPCYQKHMLRKPYLRWQVQPDGFSDKQHLYGLWRSRKLIVSSKCLVLVEGAGDVWRLHEANIGNAVAIMGRSLQPAQQIAIERCSPSNLIVMTDDDETGNKAAEEIERFARRLCRVHRLKPQAKDIGAMTAADVESAYRKEIERWMRRSST